MYAHAAFQALPIAASVTVAVRGRRQPVPYPRLVTWCVVLVITDILDLAVARFTGSNLWTAYATLPVEVGLSIWLLATWQPNELLHLAYVTTIPIMGSVVVVFLLLTDPAKTFYRWVAPFLSLLALCASLHTLVHRSVRCRGPLAREGWFWVCLGLSLFWTGYVSVPVFGIASSARMSSGFTGFT